MAEDLQQEQSTTDFQSTQGEKKVLTRWMTLDVFTARSTSATDEAERKRFDNSKNSTTATMNNGSTTTSTTQGRGQASDREEKKEDQTFEFNVTYY
ncbi:uncharacterized protein L199_000476 [Kwoniella botswanensis]|uniref:uncharacterized protein n=1 Tax=Kwoniella botswanensis TaxID=1268659 RepID=UPI00315CBB3C